MLACERDKKPPFQCGQKQTRGGHRLSGSESRYSVSAFRRSETDIICQTLRKTRGCGPLSQRLRRALSSLRLPSADVAKPHSSSQNPSSLRHQTSSLRHQTSSPRHGSGSDLSAEIVDRHQPLPHLFHLLAPRPTSADSLELGVTASGVDGASTPSADPRRDKAPPHVRTKRQPTSGQSADPRQERPPR
eukprot:1466058-Rhodomonas_salina.1